MATTHWGRKETIIFPPHSPIYSYGAVFLAFVLTGCFVYLRFSFGQTPLQQFYTPIYARSAAGGAFNKTDKYQLLDAAGVSTGVEVASDLDVQAGTTLASGGKQIPLALSAAAQARGLDVLYRGPVQKYVDARLHTYLQNAVYGGEQLRDIYKMPLLFGLLSLLAQLPFAIAKDITRRKELKYGRRLKGPVMLTPKEFNKTVHGDGIGFKTTEAKEMMRIPLQAEAQHIELMGDTGAGKTTLIMQILRQIQGRGHAAIVYDPACEFIQRFFDAKRGDIVLNPLDDRCPYWGPSEELRRRAEAKAIAASLYQPTSDKKGEFFTETPQKIFAHLLTKGPTPEQLVAWLSNPAEIDQRVRGTEMEAMIAKGAQQQRNGVLASLGLVADSLRMLPTREQAGNRTWSATEWAETRAGWIFITSSATEREALRPLHSLWIDLLVMRLLTAPQENQTPVWFVLDELASLQRLPQLHTAITENRKSRNPLVLGFQGKAQLEVIYGHLAEVMLSQPATKIFLKTTEPKAAEWVDNNPMKLVRQSAKREKVPDVLDLAELQLLLTKLSVRERTLALLDAATGLRVSELLALRWDDVDFENLELSVTRSIWHQVVGNCKTEASAKPVPIDDYMAEDLLSWRRQSPYPMGADWVFASPSMGGKQPYWPDNLMKRYIKPVARKAGITKNIGWHTFRHSFGTLLKANGEDIKTVQELLRHANSRITLDVYTQAVTSNKRAAQSKVVRMMVPNAGTVLSDRGTTGFEKVAVNAR